MENQKPKIEEVSVQNLVPSPYNPRKWSAKEFKKLVTSMKNFGFLEPIVVNKRNNIIVSGNRRFQAAVSLGYTEIPVVYIDVDEDHEKLLNVAFNDIDFGFDEQKKEILLYQIQNNINPELLSDLLGLSLNEAINSTMPKTAEIEFSPELHKKKDYVMVLFDSETDFLNFVTAMGLKQVYDVQKGKSVGMGRVIKYEKLLNNIKNL